MEINEIREKLTIPMLKTLYRSSGAEWGEVNLFGIRAGTSSADDMFDDLLGIAIEISGVVPVPILRLYQGTTDPGKWWTLNPVTYKKVKGAAHLREGFWKGIWKVGTHAKGTAFAHEALVGASGIIEFWRDTNENCIYDPAIDVIQKERNDIIGINRHRAGLDDPANIGLYGAGCQVKRYHKEHLEEMQLIKNSFTYTQDPNCLFDYFLINKNNI